MVEDPAAKLDEYVAHRLERERRIVAALDAGARTEDELLDAAWDAIPPGLRLPARWTLRAHLDKLRDEGAELLSGSRPPSRRRARGAAREPARGEPCAAASGSSPASASA